MLQTIAIFLTLVLLLTACAQVPEEKRDVEREVRPRQLVEKPFYSQHELSQRQAAQRPQIRKLVYRPQLATAIRKLDSIHNAWVIAADRRAYVAVILNESVSGNRLGVTPLSQQPSILLRTRTVPGDVPDSIKTEIENLVRQTDRTVTDVYVSSSRAMIHRLHELSVKSKKGYPLQSQIASFETLVMQMMSTYPKEMTLRNQLQVIK